jgi:hypothetical protein
MFRDEEPRRRPPSDSANAAARPPAEPADRHARRLGVLGHVERRLCGGTVGKEPAARPRVTRPAHPALVVAAFLDTASVTSIAALMPPLPTIAA